MRGIRGAICAEENTRDAIHAATRHLLTEIAKRNRLELDDIVAVFFTMTPDLDADFPAYAVRDMGWTRVPMLGAQETPVPGALERAIRVLVLARGRAPSRHVYLGRAASMRPDLIEPGDREAWNGAERGPALAADCRLGRALIVGLGLIGGSLAAATRTAGLFSQVAGHDRDVERAREALRLGLVDAAVEDLVAGLRQADFVVLAAPVTEIQGLLARFATEFKRGAIVTDVGSTKRGIVAAMSRLPERVRAVGGHPLAGDTRSGPSAARADLFRGAVWALVETARTDREAMEAVEHLVQSVGSRPLRMSAAAHDRVVALVSHVPAVAAMALSELAARRWEGGPTPLVGPGFMGATRLAAGSPPMTAEMLVDNADNVQAAIDELIVILRDLQGAVSGEAAALAERVRQSGSLRASLLKRSRG